MRLRRYVGLKDAKVHPVNRGVGEDSHPLKIKPYLKIGRVQFPSLLVNQLNAEIHAWVIVPLEALRTVLEQTIP